MRGRLSIDHKEEIGNFMRNRVLASRTSDDDGLVRNCLEFGGHLLSHISVCWWRVCIGFGVSETA